VGQRECWTGAKGRRYSDKTKNEGTDVRTCRLGFLQMGHGHGEGLYRWRRAVSLCENKGRWAARRIVLKPGIVSVIAGSIYTDPKRACTTRRRRGCPLGRNPKRLQKGCAQANFGLLSGQSRGAERFVDSARERACNRKRLFEESCYAGRCGCV
jgi:hypothetical protein